MKLNKMRNIRIEIDGIKFQSKKEGKRYIELKLLVRGGYITDLQLQVEFVLIKKEFNIVTNRDLKYKPDFCYRDENDKYIVEDVKGRKKGTQYTFFRWKNA